MAIFGAGVAGLASVRALAKRVPIKAKSVHVRLFSVDQDVFRSTYMRGLWFRLV